MESLEEKSISISQGNVDGAITIMREAAEWLIQTGKPNWRLEDLTKEALLSDEKAEDFYLAKFNGEDAAAMILKWHDPFFWPDIEDGESGFIHKLSVRRMYAGLKIPERLVEFAVKKCKERGANALRLDTVTQREKLCKLYEGMGFVPVARRIMPTIKALEIDITLFELKF